ncbi:MAG: hypothetical protein R2941_21255 [Desulfobacterales bacterium]
MLLLTTDWRMFPIHFIQTLYQRQFGQKGISYGLKKGCAYASDYAYTFSRAGTYTIKKLVCDMNGNISESNGIQQYLPAVSSVSPPVNLKPNPHLASLPAGVPLFSFRSHRNPDG